MLDEPLASVERRCGGVVLPVTTQGTGMHDHVDEPTQALTSARVQREALLHAMLRLEETAAAPAHGREPDWASAIDDSLSALRGALEHHVLVTEGPGGLYDEVRDLQPRLHHRVHALAEEHSALAGLVGETGALAAQASDPDAVEACRESVTLLLARLMRHRQRGLDLVYEAYVVDVGGSD